MQGEAKGCRDRIVGSTESYAFSIIVTVVVVAWCIWCFVLWAFADKLAGLGQVGDSFGSLNVLLTGLAFAAVYHQLKLQKYEILVLENSIKDTKKAEAVRAQPYLVFNPYPVDSQTEYIMIRVPFRNFRALATDVQFESDWNRADCEISTEEGQVILSREHADTSGSNRGAIRIVLRHAAREGYLKATTDFSLSFRISYRDELGNSQSRPLMLVKHDEHQKTIKLTDGWSWDLPRTQGDA